MSKVLVMYYSKYGSAKNYAQWIATELGADIYPVNKVPANNFDNYDAIILGSSLYAGSISGIDIIIKNYEQIKTKKLILFTCGIADYSKPENINTINARLNKEIPPDIMQNFKVFYLRGGMNYKKLSLKHKIMMWLLKKMIERKKEEELAEDDKELLKTYGEELDFMDKSSITGIIDYCRGP